MEPKPLIGKNTKNKIFLNLCAWIAGGLQEHALGFRSLALLRGIFSKSHFFCFL